MHILFLLFKNIIYLVEKIIQILESLYKLLFFFLETWPFNEIAKNIIAMLYK